MYVPRQQKFSSEQHHHGASALDEESWDEGGGENLSLLVLLANETSQFDHGVLIPGSRDVPIGNQLPMNLTSP